jgi:hypothetical protein
MSRHTKHQSRSRGVGYAFEAEEFSFDVEKRLAKAKADGVITEYDDGRGRNPWFNGPPGPALRALRDEFAREGKISPRGGAP